MSFGTEILEYLTNDGFEVMTVRVDKSASQRGRAVNKVRVGMGDGAVHYFEFTKDLALNGEHAGRIIASVLRKENV